MMAQHALQPPSKTPSTLQSRVIGDERPQRENSETAAGSAGDARADASTFDGDGLVIGYPGLAEPVVEDASICVPPGEVTALVGPNGSGKSTLLGGLADQIARDAGSVHVDGTDITELGDKELARKLGLLSQENVSPGAISVEELVSHGRYPHRGFFEGMAPEDYEAIDRAISLAGVELLRERELGQLSGGQAQLAWIAMVLAQETDVLLLDEPNTFLDLHHQLEVMDIVRTLRDEWAVTVVLVLHDIDQAARFADYMVALDDGEVYASGRPEDVVTAQLLADVFEVEASVDAGDHGPRVTPLRPLHADE
jgi:iron complex transport system ATP-binding protein